MDTIADMLTIIRNGYLARKKNVLIRYSSQKESIIGKLVELGFLESVKVEHYGNRKRLVANLLYLDSKPAIEGIEIISNPSIRIYTRSKKIPKVLNGLGEVVISTPKGILTGAESKTNKTGGEILFKVW